MGDRLFRQTLSSHCLIEPVGRHFVETRSRIWPSDRFSRQQRWRAFINQPTDQRFDTATATCISEALRLQAEFGYDRAWKHLEEFGVKSALAQEILCIGFDRRKSDLPSPLKTVGVFAQSARTAYKKAFSRLGIDALPVGLGWVNESLVVCSFTTNAGLQRPNLILLSYSCGLG